MMAEGGVKIHFENHVIQLLEKMEKIPKSAKEVFLWDLIRISSGDIYNYRKNLADKTKVDEEELCIRLVTNEENKSLSIIDTGIGMTKDELIDGIGKISEDQVIEYKGIIDQYLMKGDPDAYRVPNSSFCLGVYSAFMVAHKVVISTKKNGHDPYVWESKASDGFFRIAPAPDTNGDDKLDRGTKVTLYLNPDDFKYLEESTLRVLVNKHTFDLCPYPIYVSAEDEREKKRQRTAGAKEREEELKRFQEEFWGLQQLCEEALKGLVKEVVVNDRVFDLPSSLSADKKRFEINPRSPIMKSLLEEYNRDPKGEREILVDTFKVHYLLHIADTGPSFFAKAICIDCDDDDTSLNDQVGCGTSSTT